MNWFTILKIDPEFMMDQKELVREPVRETSDSKVIDLERVTDIDVAGNCCEAARNEVMTLLSQIQRRYENEGRSDREKDAEKNMKIVEGVDCKQLLQIVYTHWKKSFTKPPEGMKLNPEYLEWRRIYEEWKECDKDVV